MKVLIACEESQRVCTEFRRIGHEAYSCDIVECSGGHPEWHIQQDVLPLLNGDCGFTTIDGAEHYINGTWDLIIAHPPCTYLTVAGACSWQKRKESGEQGMAMDFFTHFVNADCEKIAIENPVGIMNTAYRKPNQIIQPWMFGDEARKRTCLWLKGLPELKSTDIVGQGELYKIVRKSGKSKGKIYTASAWYQELARLDPVARSRERSKTFPGIARAMAEQWGGTP